MTSNPLHSNSSCNISLLLVMRSSDKRIVASLIKSQEITVEGVRECVAGNPSMIAGKKYSTQGTLQSIHYTLDSKGRVYALVSSPKYPVRIAFIALEELRREFSKEFGPRVATSSENGLSRAASNIFKSIITKYENPSKVDALANVQEKVEVVKSTMKENIQQLLINEEKLERIDNLTQSLNEQAQSFQHGARDLNNQMWWRMWKMRLLLFFLITSVLVIIIVPVAVNASKKK